MSDLNEIRGLVFSYLVNSIDLAQFCHKFEPIFRDIEDCGDTAAIELSYAVEAALAKTADGILSVDQLRLALEQATGGFSAAISIADEYQDRSPIRVKQVETSSCYADFDVITV